MNDIPPTALSHERKALLLLRTIIMQHMIDEWGYIRKTGCLDVIEAGINCDPLATWDPNLTEGDMVTHLRNTGWRVEKESDEDDSLRERFDLMHKPAEY